MASIIAWGTLITDITVLGIRPNELSLLFLSSHGIGH